VHKPLERASRNNLLPREEIETVAHIKKRDGKILEIEPLKIKAAIAKAVKAKREFKHVKGGWRGRSRFHQRI
jgi:hypothetical protein